MAIIKSHHIAVATPDMKRLADFYTNVMGFHTDGYLGNNIVFIDIGGTRLELINNPDVTEAQPEGCKGMLHLAFEVDDVQRTCKELEAKGVTFYSPAREARPGLWNAFFRDPDGNILELFQATPQALGLS